MYKYRVVKVTLDGNLTKYAPQKKYINDVLKWKWNIFPVNGKAVVWQTLFKVVDGTDMLIPCYYDTAEEAWDRVEKHEKSLIIDGYKIEISDEYYEK